MAVDISRFTKANVADTCAVWNVLSSLTLYSASRSVGVTLCCTGYVMYECLVKPRRNETMEQSELKERLRRELTAGNIRTYSLEIADLQNVGVLERRKNLSKGELTSIAFAGKTRQAFLTDDQQARKLAAGVLEAATVQTTPHLFGWLMFTGALLDGDKGIVIREHETYEREPLTEFFEAMHHEALRCRLMSEPA